MLHLLADNAAPTFWLPQAASKNAAASDGLFWFVLIVNIVFSSLIMAMMIVFVIKYRHRKGRAHDPTAGHSTALELTWTIIPTLLVLVIFYYGFKGYLHANTMPPNATEIMCNGQMWNWTFTYPNGHTDPELHLVVNKPALMVLNSADVIHDLDIPAFRMKKDVVPGRYNKEWFEPTLANTPPVEVLSWKAGTAAPAIKTADEYGYYGLYSEEFPDVTADLVSGDTFGFKTKDGKSVAISVHEGKETITPLDFERYKGYSWKKIEFYQVFCAMYCGTNHSTMLAKCVVQNQDDFDKWLAYVSKWEDKKSYIERGEELHKAMGCATCHTVDGSTSTGPTWKDLYGSTVPLEGAAPVLADDAYIVESIVDPPAKIVQGFKNVMPSDFKSKLKPADLIALTWYMKSISSHYKGDLAEGKKVGAAMALVKPAGPATAPATAPAEK